MPAPAPLRLGATRIRFEGDLAITTLPDGAEVVAAPQDTEAYRATARRLGYGDDTARMCREHDACHAWLAAILCLPESPTLSNVAHGRSDSALTGLEEDAVMAIQAFACAAGVDLMAVMARTQAANG